VLSGERLEVDAEHAARESEIDPIVDEPIPFHAMPQTRFLEDPPAAVLDHSCSYTAQHVFLGAQLEDHALNPSEMEQMSE
jgi:hypothetical protein